MGLLRVALFASIALGVTGSPLDESTSWQSNNTAYTTSAINTTSSDDDAAVWTVFAPVTQVPGGDLDVPGAVTSSPVTQHTQLSLEGPESQPSASQTPAPKPIVQPSESSLLIPIATVSNGKTYVTIAPSAHLEHSGTILVRPEGETGSPTLGIVGSELVDLPANTGSAATHHDQDDSASGAGSNGDGDQHSPANILVGDTPLTAGGSPVTLDGTTYSLEPTGSAVVINGNTVSFSTNSRGQVMPVETASSDQSGSGTDDSDAEALGKLSAVSAEATATAEGAQGTASATSTATSGNSGSSGTTSGGGGSSSSSNNDGNEDAEATGTTTSAGTPATQSDNAGAAIASDWSLSALLGAVGLLAAVI